MQRLSASQNKFKSPLAGRMICDKVITLGQRKNTLMVLWKCHLEVEIFEIDESLFLFQFALLFDKRCILLREPWIVNPQLLALKELERLRYMKLKDYLGTILGYVHKLPFSV